MHLSATWQSWPFQRSWTTSPEGDLWIELQLRGWLAQVGNKARSWGPKVWGNHASLVMKSSLWVKIKAKKITSHFYWLWARKFNNFLTLGKLKLSAIFLLQTLGKSVMNVISTNFEQVMHLFTQESRASFLNLLSII